MNTVTVECVICGHTKTIELTPVEPMCDKCLGPMIVKKVETKPNEQQRQVG